MENLKTNFVVGIISYLSDKLPNLDERIEIHTKQMSWLDTIDVEFDIWRVESDWDKELTMFQHNQKHTLRRVSVGPHPPGHNRNVLLKAFYDSDYDWLVCMDDDRALYPMYNGDAFFGDLRTPKLIDLAKRGHLITCTPPTLEPFKKDNCAWAYKEDNWYFVKELPQGFIQICFIPNLRKYGMEPIYFDAETMAGIGEAPEDLKFQLDWLIAKHPMVRNKNLIMQEIGKANGASSTIYTTEEYRHACEASHKEWMARYLKESFPRNPKYWTKGGLSKRNPAFMELVPRTEHYEFNGRDLPR